MYLLLLTLTLKRPKPQQTCHYDELPQTVVPLQHHDRQTQSWLKIQYNHLKELYSNS